MFWNKKDTRIPRLLHEMHVRPENFEINQYTLTHKPSSESFWIANGLEHYGPHHSERCVSSKFTPTDQKRFSDALKYVKAIVQPYQAIQDLPEATKGEWITFFKSYAASSQTSPCLQPQAQALHERPVEDPQASSRIAPETPHCPTCLSPQDIGKGT